MNNKNKNILKNLNRRFAWMKIVLVFIIGIFLSISILNFTYNNSRARRAEKVRLEEMDRKEKEARELLERKEKERQAIEEAKRIEEEKKIEQEKREKNKEKVKELTGKKVIALTFDDGPNRVTTSRLLDILGQKKVKATFFVLGSAAINATDIVKREYDDGHEVQGHTMFHGNFAQMSRKQIEDDIKMSDDLMEKIIGSKPNLIRPPYGVVTAVAGEVVKRPFVCWDIDTLDWKYRNATSVRQRAVSGARNGAIILMHDIHKTSVDAVPGIIDDLRAMGYEFVTVSELAMIKNIELVPGKAYWGF